MAYSYFERLVFFFFSILTLLVIVLNVIDVFLTIIVFIYALGGFILRWVIPFLRSNVDDRRVSRDVTNVYHLNFLIGVFLNKMALLLRWYLSCCG